MAEKDKRYYWLKLKEGFFGEKEIKKLRKIAGGDTYTIIYLKLMLLSLRENGRLYFDGIEDNFYEELALEIDEEPDNVKFTLIYLQKMGLMEEISNVEAFLTQIPECVGSETDKAQLMRKSRARKKALALQDGNNVTEALPPVTNRYPEIEKDIDIELDIEKEKESMADSPNPPAPPQKPKKEKPVKHKKGEYQNVLLTDVEEDKLIEEYGMMVTLKAITFLDEYIEMKGYKAKSHYLAIRKWVIDAVGEQERKNGKNNTSSTSKVKYGGYDPEEAFRAALARSESSFSNTAVDKDRVEALKARIGQ